MNELQYMALSAMSYSNLPAGNNPDTNQSWTIGDLISHNQIEGYYTDTTHQHISPRFASLAAISDFVLIGYQPNTASGFGGVAVQDPATGQVSFAFRGTDIDPTNPSKDIVNSIRDIITDITIAVPGVEPKVTTQFTEAYDFVKGTLEAVAGHSLSSSALNDYVAQNDTAFTGHSLGGGLAQYLSYVTSGSATTFNAVGIGQVIGVDAASAAGFNVVDYVNTDDIIGNFGVQLGTTHYLEGDISDVNVNASYTVCLA